jgi:hypothetical protein
MGFGLDDDLVGDEPGDRAVQGPRAEPDPTTGEFLDESHHGIAVRMPGR